MSLHDIMDIRLGAVGRIRATTLPGLPGGKKKKIQRGWFRLSTNSISSRQYRRSSPSQDHAATGAQSDVHMMLLGAAVKSSLPRKAENSS